MRVRFAPSPTGQLHVGNARTALFNWLLARRHGGTFVLRIEDTDAERSTVESERAILEDLRWLGLDWDEGPAFAADEGQASAFAPRAPADKSAGQGPSDGPFAPYRQSERLDRYRTIAHEFLASGRAYYCFCTPDELEAARAAALAAGRAPKYAGACRRLDRVEAARRVEAGEAAAIRFVVPDDRTITFTDIVRGDVSFHTDVVGDWVILRSDGRPAYNFAVVVDDVDMQITHVIRGEDHISNTPRQILVYEALGARPPQFAHLSLVLGPDHAPLSKRHGATSVAEFRARGYLPEALVNYLALLGWSPGGDLELMTLDDMVPRFNLDHVSHSAAVFDPAKLAWMNRHHMKEASPERLVRDAWPAFRDAGYVHQDTSQSREFLASLLPMAVGSVDRIEEIPSRLQFLFEWDEAAAAALVRAEPGGAEAVTAFASEIAEAPPLDRERFREAAARARERTGLKGRALFHPLRAALTAADSGPELDLAVPAIDRGAALDPAAGVKPIPSCATRALVVARLVAAGGA